MIKQKITFRFYFKKKSFWSLLKASAKKKENFTQKQREKHDSSINADLLNIKRA